MTPRHLALLALIIFLTACNLPQQTATLPLPSATSSSVPSNTPSLMPSSSPSTSAPTETLLPAPRSFTEEFNGNLPDWSFVQVDNGQPVQDPVVEAGFLVFKLPAPDQWSYAIYNNQNYADVRIDTHVEIQMGDDGSVGAVCRYSEKNGWYEFDIFADQTYVLLFGQWLKPGTARYLPMYRGESEKIKSGPNEIGLDCTDNVLTPFINGVQMRKWQDTKYGLDSGNVGISASSFQNVPFMANYDWVKVSEP